MKAKHKEDGIKSKKTTLKTAALTIIFFLIVTAFLFVVMPAGIANGTRSYAKSSAKKGSSAERADLSSMPMR